MVLSTDLTRPVITNDALHWSYDGTILNHNLIMFSLMTSFVIQYLLIIKKLYINKMRVIYMIKRNAKNDQLSAS